MLGEMGLWTFLTLVEPMKVDRAQTINKTAMNQGVSKPGIQTENSIQTKGRNRDGSNALPLGRQLKKKYV